MPVDLRIIVKDDGTPAVKRFSKTVKSETRKAGRSVDSLSNKLGKNLKTQILALGSALSGAAIARQIGKLSFGFETAIAEVSTISKSVENDVRGVSDSILEMSRQLPQSATALSKGLYQTISAGVTDTADAMKLLKISTRAAIGGLTTTEVAVDALTSVINAYSLSVNDASRISDLMFTTVKEGKIRFDELASVIGDMAPTAAVLGIDFKEIAASMATLTKSGVNFNVAATQMRNIMLRILQPQKEAKETARQYGIELSRIGVEKAGGFVQFISDVNAKLGDNVEALSQIFPDIRAFSAAATLAGTRSKELSRILDEMAGSIGASDRAFTLMADTAESKVKISLNKINESFIRLGQKVLPPIADALDSITDAMDRLGETFENSKIQAFFQGFGDALDAMFANRRDDFANFMQDMDAISKLGFFDPNKEKTKSEKIKELLAELARERKKRLDAQTAREAEIARQRQQKAERARREIAKSKKEMAELAQLGSVQIFERQDDSKNISELMLTIKDSFVATNNQAQMMKTALSDMPDSIDEMDFNAALFAQNMQSAANWIAIIASGLAESGKTLNQMNLSDFIKSALSIASVVPGPQQPFAQAGLAISDLFGFQHGGQFQVRGSGGTDSQVVAFRATPGEQVTVTRPGQTTVNSPINVNISANRVDEFSIRTMLIPAINRAVQDNMVRLRANDLVEFDQAK